MAGQKGEKPFWSGCLCARPLSLFGVALAACLLPARRAVRVEPAAVLRND